MLRPAGIFVLLSVLARLRLLILRRLAALDGFRAASNVPCTPRCWSKRLNSFSISPATARFLKIGHAPDTRLTHTRGCRATAAPTSGTSTAHRTASRRRCSFSHRSKPGPPPRCPRGNSPAPVGQSLQTDHFCRIARQPCLRIEEPSLTHHLRESCALTGDSHRAIE